MSKIHEHVQVSCAFDAQLKSQNVKHWRFEGLGTAFLLLSNSRKEASLTNCATVKHLQYEHVSFSYLRNAYDFDSAKLQIMSDLQGVCVCVFLFLWMSLLKTVTTDRWIEDGSLFMHSLGSKTVLSVKGGFPKVARNLKKPKNGNLGLENLGLGGPCVCVCV